VTARQVGTLVNARWENRTKHYPGFVSRINGDGTYAVRFHDGDFDPRVELASIQFRVAPIYTVPVIHR
jgi:hypothetical protein